MHFFFSSVCAIVFNCASRSMFDKNQKKKCVKRIHLVTDDDLYHQTAFHEVIKHCVKSVRFRSYSGPYFSAFGLNTDQNNSEYGHILRSKRLFLIMNEWEWWRWMNYAEFISYYSQDLFWTFVTLCAMRFGTICTI